MHNGGIAEFDSFKRKLQLLLPDKIFNIPQGNTDSEWCFALYLAILNNLGESASTSSNSKQAHPNAKSNGTPVHHSDYIDSTSPFPPSLLRQAMLDTIAKLNSFTRAAGVEEPSLMNFCVTDGETVVATRYISSKQQEAASLYYSSGTTFSEDSPGGHYRMSKLDKRENIIMIASEPLTFEKGALYTFKSFLFSE